MTPDVSIFIPVWNRPRMVAQAIESVLNQTYKNFTLIVSDNCSTDNTRDVIAKYASRDHRVVLRVQERNVGGTENGNRFLRTVNTPFCMLLCSDDLLIENDAIQKARAIMDKYPEVASVYCDLLFVDEDVNPLATRRFSRKGLLDSRMLAIKSIYTTRNYFGIALLNRTDRMRGLQYEESSGYAADVDASIATAKDLPVYHIPEVLIANRFHGSNYTISLLSHARRDMLTVARKHGIHLSLIDYLKQMWFFPTTLLMKYAFFSFLNLRRKWKHLLK